jgi:hypothetical protein
MIRCSSFSKYCVHTYIRTYVHMFAIQRHLDIHFRLFREDFMHKVRDGISEYARAGGNSRATSTVRYAHIPRYIHICIHTYMHANIHTCLSVAHMFSSCFFTNTHTHTRTYIHAYIHTYISVAHMLLSSWFLRAHIHAYMHTYMHISSSHLLVLWDTHTYIHIYRHIQRKLPPK